jgi:hypothetical protein
MKIYVASSWRNELQPGVVKALRAAGHEVYDFRNPALGIGGFHWSDIDPDWQNWTPADFRWHLDHPIARRGFTSDYDAMVWAEAFVLVMPCGRSAHLEMGWATGSGKITAALLSDGEPELMYNLIEYLCIDIDELLTVMKTAARTRLG